MVAGTLPKSGKKIWESVYQEAKKSGDSQEIAAKKAWGAVRQSGWTKKDGKWIKKSDLVQTFSMFISKAVRDGKIMRWQAVNSDTDPDSHEERMSLDLYQDFISHIENKDPIPEMFRSAVCSDFWCGGTPYLSISHYPDLNGKAVPGEPTQIFVDGKELKAKGVLYDNPLGHATYRSLQNDKDKSPEDKIRISIGFLDLAHKHGENGSVWVRESAMSVCPECFDGMGDKIYVKGYLVHLAMTRVPVNKRTQMVLEEKSEMSKKIPTRKEDAASIVGEDLAKQVDAINKASTLKSDVLIEMSESEEPNPEETKELVAEVEGSEDKTEESAPVEEKSEVPAEPEKSEPVSEKSMDTPMLPYGGATSMKDAKKQHEAMEEMSDVFGMFSMFQNVVWNIVDSAPVAEQKNLISKCVDEFKSMLAAKAMVEFSAAKPEPVVAKSESAHPLKSALDAVLASVDNSVVMEGDLNAKLQFVQPSINELGQAIMDYVQTKSIVSQEEPAAPENKDTLLDDIKKLIQPVVDGVAEIATLSERVGVLEAKSRVEDVQPRTNRIPQPRTQKIAPNLSTKSEAPKSSIRSVVNKSVGLPENS
jgi:hypothetical protein